MNFTRTYSSVFFAVIYVILFVLGTAKSRMLEQNCLVSFSSDFCNFCSTINGQTFVALTSESKQRLMQLRSSNTVENNC